MKLKVDANVFCVSGGEAIGELMARLTHTLCELGIEEAYEEARLLICAAAPISRLDLIVRPERSIDTSAATRVETFVRRRMGGEPVSRILGTRGFWSFDLEVRENVLDPRADTECLIEACIALMKQRRMEPLRILDVGTGSGAVLAGVLTEFPQAIGVGIDLSADATNCARDNLERLGLSHRATIAQRDWRDPLEERFDVVLSNPPYIETAMISRLDPEVRDHDPIMALDGGADGLDAYRSITAHAQDWLKDGGVLILEIGYTQAARVSGLLNNRAFASIGIRQDLAGRDRVVHAQLRA